MTNLAREAALDAAADAPPTDEERLHHAPSQIAACLRFREVLEILDSLITPQAGATIGADGEPMPPFPPVIDEAWGENGWPDQSIDLVGPFIVALRRWILAGAELCDPPLAELGHAEGTRWRAGAPGEVLRIGPIVSAWLAQAKGDDDEAKLCAVLDGDDFDTFALGFAHAAGSPMSKTVVGLLRSGDDARQQALPAKG